MCVSVVIQSRRDVQLGLWPVLCNWSRTTTPFRYRNMLRCGEAVYYMTIIQSRTKRSIANYVKCDSRDVATFAHKLWVFIYWELCEHIFIYTKKIYSKGCVCTSSILYISICEMLFCVSAFWSRQAKTSIYLCAKIERRELLFVRVTLKRSDPEQKHRSIDETKGLPIRDHQTPFLYLCFVCVCVGLGNQTDRP